MVMNGMNQDEKYGVSAQTVNLNGVHILISLLVPEAIFYSCRIKIQLMFM